MKTQLPADQSLWQRIRQNKDLPHLINSVGANCGKILIIIISISSVAWGLKAHRASSEPNLKADNPPSFYSDQMRDDLGSLLQKSLRSARSSIYLEIFTLSDFNIVSILNELAKQGVRIHILTDSQSISVLSKLDSRITFEVQPSSGLMHRKIAVIDSEIVWIGSANITDDSLYLHHNFLIGLQNSEIAAFLQDKTLPAQKQFTIADQTLELWMLPQYKAAQDRIIDSLDRAVHSIRIAMFSWTSLDLVQAVIRAKERGLSVMVVLDRQGAQGASAEAAKKLIAAGVDTRLSMGLPLLHYKFAWIDDQELLMGSANWTAGGLKKNREIVARFPMLTFDQNCWLQKLWQRCWVEATNSKIN